MEDFSHILICLSHWASGCLILISCGRHSWAHAHGTVGALLAILHSLRVHCAEFSWPSNHYLQFNEETLMTYCQSLGRFFAQWSRCSLAHSHSLAVYHLGHGSFCRRTSPLAEDSGRLALCHSSQVHAGSLPWSSPRSKPPRHQVVSTKECGTGLVTCSTCGFEWGWNRDRVQWVREDSQWTQATQPCWSGLRKGIGSAVTQCFTVLSAL